MTQSFPPPPPSLEIETPPNTPVLYSNLARIAHAPAEFILDFARFLPGDARAVVTARVVMSPVGAKLFAQALADNIARYEATFGPIKLPSSGPSLADTLFGSIQPPQPPEQS